MLKRLLAAALLACVPAAYALNGKLFFTLAPNVADEFAHIMPYRAPSVPHVDRVVRHQPVQLVLALMNPAADADGKVLVLVESIRSISPSGKVKELVKAGSPVVALQGVKKNPGDFSGIMLARTGGTMILEDRDPLGKWRVVFTVRDKGDGSTREFTAEIELVETLPGTPDKPMTAEEMGRFMTDYYKKPDPAKIPAAFEAFVKWDGAGKSNYDPLMWLCGFAELYWLNPQFRPALIKAAAGYSQKHKLYVALILERAGAQETELKDADPELKRLFAIVKSSGDSPLAFKEVTNPAQLDALWTMFLTTGKVEPIRRLVHELRKRDGAMTLDEAKKLGRQLTKEELKKLMPSLIASAAEWSLGSNSKQHELVAFYLEAMLARKQYPDADAAVKLAAMLVNARVLETAKTPDGKPIVKPVLRPAGGRPESPYDPIGD